MRDRPLAAILAKVEHLAVNVALIHNWSPDLVAPTDGVRGFDRDARETLDGLGVPVREGRISPLEAGEKGGLHRNLLEDGSVIEREGMFYAPPRRSDLAEDLGCELEAMPLPATVIKGDPVGKETTVPGAYVAGDADVLFQGAIIAASSGPARRPSSTAP